MSQQKQVGIVVERKGRPGSTPALLARDKTLSAYAKAAWAVLDTWKDPFPSIDYLADLIPCSRNTAIKAVKELCDMGWIEVVRGNRRKREPNRYVLHHQPLSPPDGPNKLLSPPNQLDEIKLMTCTGDKDNITGKDNLSGNDLKTKTSERTSNENHSEQSSTISNGHSPKTGESPVGDFRSSGQETNTNNITQEQTSQIIQASRTSQQTLNGLYDAFLGAGVDEKTAKNKTISEAVWRLKREFVDRLPGANRIPNLFGVVRHAYSTHLKLTKLDYDEAYEAGLACWHRLGIPIPADWDGNPYTLKPYHNRIFSYAPKNGEVSTWVFYYREWRSEHKPLSREYKRPNMPENIKAALAGRKAKVIA